MLSLTVFATLFVIVIARPADETVSVTQDTLGNYNIKYVIEGISRVETRDSDGNVNGEFSYIDPDGVLRKTKFTSGVSGFNAISADIPQPVPETPELLQAKAEHLKLLEEAASTPDTPTPQEPKLINTIELPYVKALPVVLAPVIPIALTQSVNLPAQLSVQAGAIPETPEVIAARAEHLAAHEAASRTASSSATSSNSS